MIWTNVKKYDENLIRCYKLDVIEIIVAPKYT